MKLGCSGSLLALGLVACLGAPAWAASPQTPCDASGLGELLLGLFPPSPPDVRAQSARQLGECRAARAVGVLSTLLRNEDDRTVRIEVIRALGVIGTSEARKALEDVPVAGLPPRLLAEIRKALEPIAKPAEPAVRTPSPQELPPAAPPQVAGKLRESDSPESGFTSYPSTDVPKIDHPEVGPSRPVATPTSTPPLLGDADNHPPRMPAPVPVEQPELPFEQQDGLALSIATSAVAGGTLMPFLAALADQKSPLTLTLTSSAGAVIAGGSAWGLSRFGKRPTLAEATWYTNVTAWGTLSGLSLYSGLFANSDLDPAVKDKALWGLLAGGETLGLAAGLWSSQHWKWTPREMVLANGLVLGSALTYGGTRLLSDHTFDVTPPIAIATIPVMVAAAVAARNADPTAADIHLVGASTLAAGWSGFLLANGAFAGATERQRIGGLLAGLGGGFLTSAGVSAFTEVEPSRSWASLAFLVAGNGLGLGTAMVARPLDDTGAVNGREWMLGSVLGGVALGSAAFAAWPHLEFGDQAAPMAVAGVAYGSLTWGLALKAADKGEVHPEDRPRFFGGMLAGGVAAGTAGLIASRWFHPDNWDQFVVASTTALGMSGGLGAVGLLQPRPEQKGLPEVLGVLGGSALGFATGAFAQHRLPLDGRDALAGGAGIVYGGLVGSLLPTLGNPEWQRTGEEGVVDARAALSGGLLGIALGGAAAAAARHAVDATPGQVAVPSVAGMLGLGMGTGLGLMVERDSLQPARIGAVVGTTGLIGASIVADRWLQLSSGLRPSAAGFGALGVGLGTAYGLLLADLPGDSTGRQYAGGALLGASAGTAAGLVIARYADLTSSTGATVSLGTALGGMFGRGITLLAVTPSAESALTTHRLDTAATLVGAALGTVGSALVDRQAPMEQPDALAATVGGGYGSLLGMLAPTLGDRTWSLSSLGNRNTFGGVLTGASMGAIGGALARWTTRVDSSTVGWATLGGMDGLAAGLGVGLLVPRPEDAPDSSQAERIGIVAGTLAGLGVGTFVWPHLKIGPGDTQFIRTATLVSAWSGLWLPTVGQASFANGIASARLGQRMAGGLLAGAGVASLGSSLLSPVLELDEDLLDDSSWMYLLWSGAGAGAGALLSTRDDVPIAAMLGAGTGGLLLGGVLHQHIQFSRSQPFAVALGVEGAWLGAWTSVLLGGSAENLPVFEGTSARQLIGGVGAGAFGGIGLAALLGDAVSMDANQAGAATLGSAVLASVTGGFSMMYPPLQNRAGVGLMMGGSAAGFVGGALLAPRIRLTDQTRAATFLGAGLGAAEALSFAWAAEAGGGQTYAGAGLVGGAVGATLGLATSASGEGSSNVLAAASFAAWGAWVGSFAGSLAFKDDGPEVHRVSLGGLIGANAGFLTGYALLRTQVISPRDIGWISLFGGAGTLLGAAATALPSSQANSRPILAGLALGPVVGMAAGAILWPRIRGPLSESPPEPAPSSPGKPSAESERDGIGAHISGFKQLFLVTEWQPVMGSLSPREGSSKASMTYFGVYGRIW